MTYNFDEIIDRRHTNALNTDGFRGYIFHAGPEKVFAFKDEEFVRMWVADMEFGVAPEILDALRARIDRRIFGYTGLYDDEYYHTFSKWCKDHYDWGFPKEQLCVSPGIIPALYQLTETLCGPDEKVLLNTPAYGYFLHAAEYAGVDVLTSPLHKKADGSFEVDYEDFERKCADPACKLVFWCNPHNPTGRMWTEDELRRVAAIIEKYNLWVVSDEIHCDMIRCGRRHIPMAKVMDSYPKLITCMAPTKTFNMAGLAFSNIIIRDPALRAHFQERDKLFGMVNPMSLTAAQAPMRTAARGMRRSSSTWTKTSRLSRRFWPGSCRRRSCTFRRQHIWRGSICRAVCRMWRTCRTSSPTRRACCSRVGIPSLLATRKGMCA